MPLNFLETVRASAMAIAASTLVSACGGGATSDASDAAAASANSAPTSADTTSTQGTTSTTGTSNTTPSSNDTTSTTTTTSTDTSSTDAAPAAAPGESVTIASASTTSAPVVSTSAPSAVQAAPRSGAAMNLGVLDYYSTEIPTIDVMKRAGVWMTQCSGGTNCTGFAVGTSSWDTGEESALDVDANGWIRSVPASTDTAHKYRSVSTMLSASGALPLGRYTVVYDGAGTISYTGATKSKTDSVAGRDVIDLTSAGNVWLTISATTPGNYLRNIRIYLPGGACANDLTTYAASASACNTTTGSYVPFPSFPSTQIWNPQFIQDVKGFRALRFMDWGHTNSATARTWADRTPPAARTWSGPNGAPIEAMLDLANAVQADAWMNIPTYADNDYAVQLGKLAALHLTGASKLDLEYSNEPWNYGFSAATWMLNQAKAKWPALVASGTNVYGLQYSWYGERLAQVCNAAKTTYPATKCVLNGQAANSWVTNQLLTCPYAAAELGHACGASVDVVAIAPYFGLYISGSAVRPTVAKWYTDADGGLTKLFEEINGQDPNGNAIAAPLFAAGSTVAGGAVAQSKSWMVSNKAVADTFKLPLWAYEGGQHLVPGAGDTDTTLVNLYITANRDPRMGAAYDMMMANWKAVGGQTFAYYSHVGAPSKYGMWGMKLSLSDATSPKWAAALKARSATCTWSGC